MLLGRRRLEQLQGRSLMTTTTPWSVAGCRLSVQGACVGGQVQAGAAAGAQIDDDDNPFVGFRF